MKCLGLALLLVAALLVAFSAAAGPFKPTKVVTDNNATCDIGTYTAATLLLPFFEVDYSVSQATGINTIFTVINTSRSPQIVRITIWTDYGYPASWFNMFMTGYDTQTISMYEWIARGNVPVTYSEGPKGQASADNLANPNFHDPTWCDRSGGTMAPATMYRLQRMLSTGQRDEPDCRIGGQHKNAIGYVTVDVVNSCSRESPLEEAYWREIILFDNVLTGDYERVNADPTTGNYAGGNPLVHIRAIPEGGPAGMETAVPMPYTFYDRYTPAAAHRIDRRQPLPSTFSARYIEGGPTGFKTNFAIWREGNVATSTNECDYAKNAKIPVTGTVVRFDEHENATTLATHGTLPVTSSISSNAPFFPPMAASGDVAGWFFLSVDSGARPRPSQGWVVVQMYAEGRYAVDFDATSLANGCTLTAPGAP